MLVKRLKEYTTSAVNLFKRAFLRTPFYATFVVGKAPREVYVPPLYDVLSLHTEDALTKGKLAYQGIVYSFDVDTFFSIYDETTHVHEYLQSFEWLNLLYQSNSFNSRSLARHLILRWFESSQKKHSTSMGAPAVTGQRLLNLIKHYDFYAQSARDDFKEYINRGISAQLKHASFILSLCESESERLSCLAGILYGQLFLKASPRRIHHTLHQINILCLKMLENLTEQHSNIRTLIREYKLLYAISKTFNWNQFEYESQIISGTLKRLEQVISFFHFQGGFFFTNEPPQTSLEADQLLRKSPHLDPTPSFLGFEKLQSYSTLAVVNVECKDVFEKEDDIPLAPFNFEMAINGEEGPLLMGSAVFLIPKQSTLPYYSLVQEIKSKRYGDKGHQWLDMHTRRMEYGTHYTHKRKIYVTNQHVRGEDLVSSHEEGLQFCANYEFNAEVFKVGDDCFRITTSNGSSWMFKLSNFSKIIYRTGEKKILVKSIVVNEDEDYSAPPLKWEMQKLSLK